MENNSSTERTSEQQDMLAADAYELDQFVYATQGQRFLNWLIDNLFMRFALAYLTGMGVGVMLGIAAPEFINNITYEESKETFGPLFWIGVLIVYVNYIVYYSICEKLFKGYTLGKLITGTRAIRQDGKELTFKDAILRTLSRLVPFEVLSGFSTLTWHDSWTKTMVIKVR